MSSGSVLLCCLIAVLLCIFLNWKLNINIGIPAIVCAWIIGYWMVDMSVKKIVAGWPTNMVFQLMTITCFFAFASQNGTLQKVASIFVYRFRKQTWALPLVIFFAGFMIGALGAPGATGNLIMGVIAYSIGAQIGINPLIMAVMACSGPAAGSELPWSAQGVIAHGIMEQYWPDVVESYTWKLWLGYFILSLIICVITSLILGGFKKRNELQIEKPEPFTAQQKQTLLIIVVVVVLSIIFSILNTFFPSAIFKKLNGFSDLMMLTAAGSLVFTLGKFGDLKAAITKGIPWNTIFMLGGMAMLVNVANEAGATDFIATALSGDIAPGLIIAALGVVAGFLSFFTGGMSVVFPMLAAMVPPIAEATGIAPYAMLIAICCGARLTALSPFSTGGALIIGACPDEKWNNYLIRGMLVVALASLALVAVFSVTGLFNLM